MSRDTGLREKMLSRHTGRYRSGLMSAVGCSLRHFSLKVSKLVLKRTLLLPLLSHMDMLVCAHACSHGHAYVRSCLLTWTCLCASMLAHMEAKVDFGVFFSFLATLLAFFPKGTHGVRLPSNLLCCQDGLELPIPCLYLPSAKITRRF